MGRSFQRGRTLNNGYSFLLSYLYININLNITYPSYPYVEVHSSAIVARVRSTGGRSGEVTHARLGTAVGNVWDGWACSDRPLRLWPSLPRLHQLTFDWSTRSRLANPFYLPRSNDLGMSRFVHFISPDERLV